ncbi:hypothetical protein CHUAL_009147 [Chamberlinius hualienensis]
MGDVMSTINALEKVICIGEIIVSLSSNVCAVKTKSLLSVSINCYRGNCNSSALNKQTEPQLQDLVPIPPEVEEKLKAISTSDDYMVPFITLENASDAIVAGFLCHYVSDHIECSGSIMNIRLDDQSSS